MKFSRKIFIAVFLATLCVGGALIAVAYQYMMDRTRDNYISRYSVLSEVMGNTLTRLDKNTELLMLNAIKVVEGRDAANGLLSTDALKIMRDELNVTHLFVINKNGNFIRSTNEDPKLIPNVFSFCNGYKSLFSNKTFVEATPVIHPDPEPKPYKFLFVPNRAGTRFLEVGMRVDFVAKSLTEALASDPNVVSMSLYAPNGLSFGRFTSAGANFDEKSAILPTSFPAVLDSGNHYQVFTKVESSQPRCCQCDESGISKNGEYYYVLKSDVSKKELAVIQAGTKWAFLLIAAANLFLAFFVSRFVSRRLANNVRVAAMRVREIKKGGSLSGRIGLVGHDEVAFLTKEFDNLLDNLEKSQNKVIETEKLQMMIQMAKEIAHNMKSPAIAIEMLLPSLSRLPDRMQKVFRDSVSEIKGMAERLGKTTNVAASTGHREIVDLQELVTDVVEEKRIEFSSSGQIEIQFSYRLEGPALVHLDRSEFRAVLSNLINNARESYIDGRGKIEVEVAGEKAKVSITISDTGKGIPEAIVSQLGINPLSFKKSDGNGLGLCHALRVINANDGKLNITSKEGAGTRVVIGFLIHSFEYRKMAETIPIELATDEFRMSQK